MPVNEIEWYDCQEVEKVILEDSCIVFSVLNFNVCIEGHAYNPSHDDEESKYYSLGEKVIEVDIWVFFTIREGGEIESFEITHIDWRN